MPAKEIMPKFNAGTLHSGSPNGPIVKSKKQAVAIELSYARKEGADIPEKSGSDKHALAQRAKKHLKPKM